jgi:hypothetical protein
MVEGYQTYYFEGTLWWKAIRPIILWYFMVEGYQTYYFVVFYGGKLSDLLFCGYFFVEGYQCETYYFVGTFSWKAIRPFILRILYGGRLSDLLVCGYFFNLWWKAIRLIILWENTYQLYIYEAKRTMAMK